VSRRSGGGGGPSCPGSSIEHKTQQCCTTCTWGQWSKWTSWSCKSCPPGIPRCGSTTLAYCSRARVRQRDPNRCPRPFVETETQKKVNTQCPAPKCCRWSKWSDWSIGACSVTCGTGIRPKLRTRTKVYGTTGGSTTCDGKNYEHTDELCYAKTCATTPKPTCNTYEPWTPWVCHCTPIRTYRRKRSGCNSGYNVCQRSRQCPCMKDGRYSEGSCIGEHVQYKQHLICCPFMSGLDSVAAAETTASTSPTTTISPATTEEPATTTEDKCKYELCPICDFGSDPLEGSCCGLCKTPPGTG
ncbi:unnamed protein product, partial [Owenia fusiformis]